VNVLDHDYLADATGETRKITAWEVWLLKATCRSSGAIVMEPHQPLLEVLLVEYVFPYPLERYVQGQVVRLVPALVVHWVMCLPVLQHYLVALDNL